MPVNGLPLVLETLLDKLVCDFGLQSWSMFGKTDCTQVSLRFSIEAMTGERDIKYKRARPSQVKRDMDRALCNRKTYANTNSSLNEYQREIQHNEMQQTDTNNHPYDTTVQGGMYDTISPVVMASDIAAKFQVCNSGNGYSVTGVANVESNLHGNTEACESVPDNPYMQDVNNAHVDSRYGVNVMTIEHKDIPFESDKFSDNSDEESDGHDSINTVVEDSR